MTVFNTNHVSTLLYYTVGYSVPLLIILITVAVSEGTNSSLYLRRDGAGAVVACWLDAGLASGMAMVLPAGLKLLTISFLIYIHRVALHFVCVCTLYFL